MLVILFGITKLVKPQAWKASLPIVVTLLGIVKVPDNF